MGKTSETVTKLKIYFVFLATIFWGDLNHLFQAISFLGENYWLDGTEVIRQFCSPLVAFSSGGSWCARASVRGDFILPTGAKAEGGEAATDIKTKASGERRGQQKEKQGAFYLSISGQHANEVDKWYKILILSWRQGETIPWKTWNNEKLKRGRKKNRDWRQNRKELIWWSYLVLAWACAVCPVFFDKVDFVQTSSLQRACGRRPINRLWDTKRLLWLGLQSGDRPPLKHLGSLYPANSR